MGTVYCVRPVHSRNIHMHIPVAFKCTGPEEKKWNPPHRCSSLNPYLLVGRTYQFLKKLSALCEAEKAVESAPSLCERQKHSTVYFTS